MVYLIYSFFPYGLLQYWLSSIKNRNKLNNTKKKTTHKQQQQKEIIVHKLGALEVFKNQETEVSKS